MMSARDAEDVKGRQSVKKNWRNFVNCIRICRNFTVVKKGGRKMEQRNRLGQDVGFERIRRITGYLVGTMDKWNDAKKAEEKDRVKHGLGKTNA